MTDTWALETPELDAATLTVVALENTETGGLDGDDHPAIAFDSASEHAPARKAAFMLGDSMSCHEPWAVQSGEQAALCLFDPFEDSANDDTSFDHPDPKDFAALPAPEATSQVEAQPAAPEEHLPSPPRLSPTQASRRIEIEPRGRAYLAVARVAALEHARRKNSTAPWQNSIAQSIILGLALPLLLGGVWVLTAPPEVDAVPQISPAAAAAAPALSPAAAPAPASGEQNAAAHKAEYEAAMRQIAAGRTDAGIALLRRGAESGYPMAQYRLSKLFEHGAGVSRNLPLALQWAERAAGAGNCRAMHDVGVYFAQGEGAPRDEATAFRWFRQAAELGVADSQYNLGIFYQQGRGVSANTTEALFWFLVAAHNRDANAIDRAVEVATGMAPEQVAQVRERARAFQARTPDPTANGTPA